MSMNPSFVSSPSPCTMPDMISKNTAGSMNHHQHVLLFEKALTPSDVGKLNRLVIPKQYAEKYFPLRLACGGSTASSSSSGKSLLSFEDEIGKIWMFRYSYWTSSQSYVLTKGWSRYVKEKGLTAGDIVSFQRQQCINDDHTGRLFIAWRTHAHSTAAFFPAPHTHCPTRPTLNLSHKYTGEENQMVSVSSTPRRLRLFGVNMEFADGV